MAKRLDDSSSSMGAKVEDGVIVKTYTVDSIEDKSSYPGKEKKYFNSGKETSLAYSLTLSDEDGKDAFLLLMGWFKRDKKTNEILDWDPFLNRANRFLSLIQPELNYIEDDLSVAPNTLLKYIGKKIQVVLYYSSRSYTNKEGIEIPNQWSRWDYIFAEDTDIEEIKKEWNAGKQYVKDLALGAYAAKLESKQYQDKEAENFNYGANNEDAPSKEDLI